ncbi:hypothetical protein ES708_26748 [subsurface metagenome]
MISSDRLMEVGGAGACKGTGSEVIDTIVKFRILQDIKICLDGLIGCFSISFGDEGVIVKITLINNPQVKQHESGKYSNCRLALDLLFKHKVN